MIKLIRNKADYEAALARIEELMLSAPEPGSPEADQLELIGLLVEDYEHAHSPAEGLDPIDALKFRMEQLDLDQRALIPHIGSRSKVSEVLSRKRQLTLPMIRALHENFGIPIESLIQRSRPAEFGPADESERESGPEPIPWERFPISEMRKRGWIASSIESGRRPTRSVAASLLEPFLEPIGGLSAASALYRQAEYVRGGREMDIYALQAWTARAMQQALKAPGIRVFVSHTLHDDVWLSDFVGLSRNEDGPLRAIDALREIGISVVVVPHLPKTQLDGAAMLLKDGMPVIGLTIRHDRTDNFWFTLLHEIAHLALHLRAQPAVFDDASETRNHVSRFYDNLDVSGTSSEEREADAWAGELLVPEAAWLASAAVFTPSPSAVAQLATTIGVAEAIVAGKARHEFSNYRILNSLVGHGAVRRLFTDIEWPDW